MSIMPTLEQRLRRLTSQLQKDNAELESTILDLRSELARKKMSLTVACNRVEELEDKLKIAVEALRRLAKSGDGTHPDRQASFYDCLPTLQIEFSERKQLAAEALEQLGELE